MMDPYSVLGVVPTATDDEVKKAYRTLCRKYHPDANINNPNKEQLEEKFKNVQTAYEDIMNQRKHKTSSFYSYSGYNSSASSYAGQSDDERYFSEAVKYFNMGAYRQAIILLNNVKNRNAEWYYVSAIANLGTNNRETALEHAKKAVSMEPSNAKYKQLLSQLENSGTFYNTPYGSGGSYSSPYGNYQQRQRSYGYETSSGSDWCLKMCCLNIFCNCCCTPCC